MTIVTCTQGKIDWHTFEGRIVYAVNQEAKNRFLEELSGKVLRGMVATAKAGGCNGGPTTYGMDRGLFGPTGDLVRRLLPGETVRMDGHRIRLLPCTDPAKIDAVHFAFNRFDQADLSIRDLARELEKKGYPSPTGKGWTHHNTHGCSRTAPMSELADGARGRVASTTPLRGKMLWPSTAMANGARARSPRRTP